MEELLSLKEGDSSDFEDSEIVSDFFPIMIYWIIPSSIFKISLLQPLLLFLFFFELVDEKILEILDIIDPDNAVQITIENEEVSKLKKDTENKQS